MKKILSLGVAVCLLALVGVWTPTTAAAGNNKLQIVKPIGENTLLMSDGSMWTWDATSMVRTQGNFVDDFRRREERSISAITCGFG